eukprot:805183-Karenia_brevis.AAC.1
MEHHHNRSRVHTHNRSNVKRSKSHHRSRQSGSTDPLAVNPDQHPQRPSAYLGLTPDGEPSPYAISGVDIQQ